MSNPSAAELLTVFFVACVLFSLGVLAAFGFVARQETVRRARRLAKWTKARDERIDKGLETTVAGVAELLRRVPKRK